MVNISAETDEREALNLEFDQQVERLLARDYSKLAGLTEEEFVALLRPLKECLASVQTVDTDLPAGRLPFVIVVTNDLVAVEKAMTLVLRDGKHGIVSLDPCTATEFRPRQDVHLPLGGAYLLVDIDRGRATLNVRPEDALQTIKSEDRSPLTIEEGVAILTHCPEFLMKNNCFSLLGSRRGDQRVPALWISEGRPKLGWCWDRNPHTWLGSASCGSRLGAAA